MKLQLFVMTVLLPGLIAFGQDQFPVEKEYIGMDVPIGVVFYNAVLMYHYQVETGESSNELVVEIQNKFEVDFDSADDLLVMLLEVSMAIEADSNAIKSALACMDGDPYEILTQMYDIDEDIGLIHYERFKKRLDKVTARYLDDWVAKIRYGMVYTRIDHRGAYQMIGKDGADTLAEMCREASSDSSR